MKVLRKTNFTELGPRHQGKVRDIYDLGESLLLVATDRVSAFDVVMDEPVPGKGKVLTELSLFWMDHLKNFCPNHLLTADPHHYPEKCWPYAGDLSGRSMLVKKCEVFPYEFIVRGYLDGSGYREYLENGTLAGIELPPGLVRASRLPKPEFTPSTKAGFGEHDENITFSQMCDEIGAVLATKLRNISLTLYTEANIHARRRGIILGDTKFEFGLYDGIITLIDEVLTPDSSRFWSLDTYEPGRAQKSLDKQPLRDYLDTLTPKWNKKPPPPALPPYVINAMSERYANALARLTR